jgi:hypothetical protein
MLDAGSGVAPDTLPICQIGKQGLTIQEI